MDRILQNIIKRQIPFLVGGTVTGIIMTYYLGFLFSVVVNSAIWMAISHLVYRLYWKLSQSSDQKFLIRYAVYKAKR